MNTRGNKEYILWKFTSNMSNNTQREINNGIDICISEKLGLLFILEDFDNENIKKELINVYDLNLNICENNITKKIKEIVDPSSIECSNDYFIFCKKEKEYNSGDIYKICEFNYIHQHQNDYLQIKYNKYFFSDKIRRIIYTSSHFLICNEKYITLISRQTGNCIFSVTNEHIDPFLDAAISSDLFVLYILRRNNINEYCIISGKLYYKRTIISNLINPTSMSLYYKNINNPHIILTESNINMFIDISLSPLKHYYYSLIDHSPFRIKVVGDIIFCISCRDITKEKTIPNHDISKLISMQLEINRPDCILNSPIFINSYNFNYFS